MLKRHPLTCRVLLLVVLPLACASIALVVYLREGLPSQMTQLRLDDGHARASIVRDRHGVATITGSTDAAVFYALGYAHAQDRMWQLELQRRMVQGRLSEVFGRSQVGNDTWMRTLGLYDLARTALPHLSVEARASLRSYADGVNAWLQSDPVLPVEFTLLDVQPQPWSELDSLAWVKMFALNLGRNMWDEVLNVVASQYLEGERLQELLRLDAEDIDDDGLQRVASRLAAGPQLTALTHMRTQFEQALNVGGANVGSNAWVVSPGLMNSGAAALANDVHLGLQSPSPWYAAQMKGDRLDVSGLTLVGIPVVIFGRNRDIAWGGTNLMADVQDLWVEQVNPRHPSQYLHEGQWQDFAVHAEIVQVRADFPASLREPPEPVKVQVRRSRNGPIVTDALGALELPVALRWTALQGEDVSYESFYRVNYAHDWNSFREAFRTYVAPALNLLYADAQGNIGSLGVGSVPIRSKGRGRFPVPGWSPEYRWNGFIPFEQWPQVFNPAEGFIVSANQKIVDAGYPYFISHDWAPPDRAARITELLRQPLREGKLLSTDYFERMQNDTLDSAAVPLAQFLKDVRVPPAQRKALSYVASWDGSMDRDSQGAAIFTVWMKYLREALFARRMSMFANKPSHLVQLDTLAAGTTYDQILKAAQSPSPWCSREPTRDVRACDEILRTSFDQAFRELRRLRGRNEDSWRWGEFHVAVYRHVPFSGFNPLALLFEPRIPTGGSRNTVNMASATFRRSSGYEQSTGASFRQIVELRPHGTGHEFMMVPGQSGNVLSSHYDDMLRPFRDGRYYEFAGTQESK